ncbi:anti-sigma factor family protein [Amycolatopsis roodepoortensis]|uniref:Anti-sigma factor RsiW n=1 Tax=Amycolatopsis roodepoortensis TaxID=700274 RepID=A0ABR9LCS9_9PSEU|nr:zf-HC2 domain-containing protein [Amycolatopsis roodepoortensis]MBE1578483.1 anti-sigma factor RsiW [Amycolatopsis roodepoortensis]
MSEVSGTVHTDIAAYVLGVLGEEDHARFEAHLLECPECQVELVEMYHLPDILDMVKKSWPDPPVKGPGPRVLRMLLADAAKAGRRRKVVRLATAAAVLVLVVGGPLAVLSLTDREPVVTQAAPTVVTSVVSPPSSSRERETGPDGGAAPFGWSEAGNAVAAEVTVQDKEWGSAVELELRGLVGPMTCQLFAYSHGGEAYVVNNWSVPAKGYGVPGSPAPLVITGSTALRKADIERFEVHKRDGTVLAIVRR